MNNLNAAEILRLLAEPSETFLQIRLRKQASIREMCRALAQTTDAHSRQVLCDVLGFRHAKSAVSLLIECLDDSSTGVRASAADALGKIGDPRAGGPLMRQFEAENALPVRRTLACVLGAVGYQPAIPHLIQCLENPDASLRGCAAWALGILRASEAVDSLQAALVHESEAWPESRIQEALQLISSSDSA
jgi:HEAT repeat protein